MIFTGTDPEYPVGEYLNAVTVNLILNIGPKPVNTPIHQNWILWLALFETTFNGTTQNWFSVLPIYNKEDWKRPTQDISKLIDSERNKQQQRILLQWKWNTSSNSTRRTKTLVLFP